MSLDTQAFTLTEAPGFAKSTVKKFITRLESLEWELCLNLINAIIILLSIAYTAFNFKAERSKKSIDFYMARKKREFYIIDQDKHLIVVDKPAGLLAVPIPGSKAKNLSDLVARHLGKHGVKVWTVHRIDRYTSGLMVFAKRHKTYKQLVDQFMDHAPERTYLALVRGELQEDEGELVHYLKLIKDGFKNVVVNKSQKDATFARLTYKVKERFNGATLVEIRLDTGLKNQIRVQFNEIGHPLVGDQHYAPEEKREKLINRQALHAYKLKFYHPAKHSEVSFKAKIPADMRRLIKRYRKKS